MAEGKSREELMLEDKLNILLAQERAAKRKATAVSVDLGAFKIEKEDIVKGIVLKEILGPPKGLEG